MRLSIRLAVAAAIAASAGFAATANAAKVQEPQPSTGNSDLLFFVSAFNPGAGTHSTYTMSLNGNGTNGTAETVNGLFNIADATGGTAGATVNYNADSNFTINVANDTALQGFISSSTTAGDVLEWGVIAGASTGVNNVPGQQVAFATVSDSGISINTAQSANLNQMLSGLGGDITTLVSKTADTYNGTTAGVLGTSTSGTPNQLTFYGNSIAMANLGIGTSSDLYAMTDSGAASSENFSLGSLLFNGTALIFTANAGSGSSVPLPAGVVLFGSGLLGLAGIGRRKSRPQGAGEANLALSI